MAGLNKLLLCLLIGAVPMAHSQEQVTIGAREDLPDAPGTVFEIGPQAGGSATASRVGTGSISGTVLDVNQGMVAGAKITLTEQGQTGERTEVSDGAGHFAFVDLAAGRFIVRIASPSLRTFVSDEVALREGEQRVMQPVALPLATTATEIEVVVTQTELAHEQVQAEEKQRIFGVIPNFYTSYIWNAAPLTSKQKFGLAGRALVDPVTFLGSAVTAGIEQSENTYPGYGQGAQGYAKRYGASYGDNAIATIIGGAILPSVLHQDPRYFYMGSGTKKARALYAVTRAVICRGDNGKWQPNYSAIGGSLAAGGISNLYHPDASRGARLTIDDTLLDIAGGAVNNLIQEFLLRHLTPKIPGYAKGKP